jgi:hypothetical protein
VRKPAHLGKVVVIATTQEAQRISTFNANQASCSGQETGEDVACAEILVGTWPTSHESMISFRRMVSSSASSVSIASIAVA